MLRPRSRIPGDQQSSIDPDRRPTPAQPRASPRQLRERRRHSLRHGQRHPLLVRHETQEDHED